MGKDHVKILLIEDDEDDYAMVRELLSGLSRADFSLEWVKTYQEGLKELCRADHDVYLLDYRLGSGNGLELIREAMGAGCDKPIIFLTGQGDHGVDMEAMRSGAADYLVKAQLTTDMLERSVRYSIARKKSERELKSYRDRLEDLVRERTEQLETANEGLQVEIAEHKRADEALQDSHSLLVATIESTADGILAVDAAGKVTSFNRSFLELWRIPETLIATRDSEQLVQFVYDQLLYPDAFLDKVRDLYRTPDASSIDELVFKDGRIFERFSQPQRIDDTIVGRVWTFRDITDRKRAEEALRESEERLEFVLKGSQLGFWDWNLETNEVKRNERWAEILGYKLEDIEFTVKQWIDFIHPDDRSMATRSIQDHLEGRTPIHEVEYRMGTKDGQYRWILDHAQVVQRDALGKPVRMSGTHTDITERKRAEAVAAQLAAIVESSDDAIIGKDLDGIITSWNRGAEKIYGYAESEVIGKPISILLPHGHEDEVLRILGKIKSGESVEHYEMVRRRKDGRDVWISLRVSPVRNAEGRIVAASMIGRDITERKLAAEALQESEERFSKFFRSSPVGISISRLSDGQFVDANDAFLGLFDYTLEELVGRNPLELKTWVNPEDRARMVEILQEQGRIQDFETQCRSKSGNIMDVLVSAEVIEAAGQRYLLGLTHDITERKRTEEALRASEQQMAAIIDFLPDATFALNSEGIVIAWNHAIEEMTGVPKEAMIGKGNLEYSLPFYGDRRPILIDLLFASEEEIRKDYRSVSTIGDSIVAEAFVPGTYGGKGAYLWGIAKPLYDKSGKVSGAIESIRDVTERAKQAREIEHLNRLYSVLSRVSQAVVRATSPETFLAQACREIVEGGGFLLSWIGQVEPMTNAVVPRAFWGGISDYVRDITVYADNRPEGRGPAGTCIREHRPVVYNDFIRDPLTLPWRDRAAPFGIASIAAFPIERAGRVWGALTIYSHEVNRFSGEDVKLLEKIAGDIEFALDNLDREFRRKQAEEALRENQSRLELALRSGHMGVWHWDLIKDKRFFDDQVCRLLGIDQAKFTGTADELFNAVHPDDREFLKAALTRTIEQDVPYETEYRAVW
ncbi:MAG: PAS domain S-box protein, partial [Syntrophobacteraceae bacterium]